MDPVAVDVLGCLDVGQCSDKTQLNDALGAEVKEIVGYQAAEGPSPYSMGRVRDISVRLFLRLLVGVLPKFCRNLFGLSGFDPKRTFID